MEAGAVAVITDTMGDAAEVAARPGRQRLMAVAFELFRDDGFAATTVDRVVARARVSKRTFYEHFRNRHHLLEDVVSGFTAAAFAANDRDSRGFGNPLQRLLALARLFNRSANSPDSIGMMRLLIAEAAKLDGLPERLHRQGVDQALALLGPPLIELGVQEPERVAGMLFELLVIAPLHKRLVGIPQEAVKVEPLLAACLRGAGYSDEATGGMPSTP